MSFQVTSIAFSTVQGLLVLKPKSDLSTRRHIGAARCHLKSPLSHFPIVSGLLVLKPKSGLSTRSPLGATMCHFIFSIV